VFERSKVARMMEQISMEWWIDMFGLVISLGVLLLAVRRDLAKAVPAGGPS